MCNTCGCSVTAANEHLIRADGQHQHTAQGSESIEVLQNLLGANDHQAEHNREHFNHHGVLAINLMSSPGAGKTTLLENTIEQLKDEFRIAVIEGDLETENDAKRIRDKGIDAIQITTGSACHLDAHMIHDALHQLELAPLDIVFIENVGNLVCPASFDLGHHLNVTLLSTPEGDDKPAKYPVIFRAADLVLLTKTDLLPYLPDFNPERAEQYVRQLANAAPVQRVSSAGEGMTQWLDWLRQQVKTQREQLEQGIINKPAIQPDGLALHAA